MFTFLFTCKVLRGLSLDLNLVDIGAKHVQSNDRTVSPPDS